MIDAESRFSESALRAGASSALTEGSFADRSLLGNFGGSGAPTTGSLGKVGVALVAVLALTLLLLAGPARAATNHVAGPTFELGELKANSSIPSQIAINEATDEVYVMGYNAGTTGDIEKFDAAGNPQNFSALGKPLLDTKCGGSCTQVAVDNTGGPNQGVIYVASAESVPPPGGCCGDGGIEVYLPSGQYLKQIKALSQTAFGVRACGVAVDENGDLVVTHGEGQTDFTYSDHLDVAGSWEANPAQEPAVDGTIGGDFANPCKTNLSSTGRVYAISGTSEFSPGQLRYWGPDEFGEPDPVGERVPASLMRTSTSVDPGPASSFSLDGDDNVYLTRTEGNKEIRKYDSANSLIETFGAGDLESPSGIAVNKGTGVIYASDRTFSGEPKVHIYNPVAVPDSLTGGFTATGQTTGTLDGEADPVGAGDVEGCEFEFTTQQKFFEKEFEEAGTAPCEPPGPLTAAEEVEAQISGLTLEAPYRYRLVTENANGSSNGTVKKFTPHAVINLTTGAATDVAPRSVTLNASFIGNSDDTTYTFQYGKTIGYGQETDAEPAGSPTGPTTISTEVDELELETLYHYRVTATNSTGKSIAEDGTFTTPPAVPGVKTSAATPITQEGVTLNGEFEGNGMNTKYFFEYGLDESYGKVSDEVDAGSPSGPTPVSSVIDAYEGYTTYHYRLVTENSLGKTYGKDQTFTTLDSPLPEVKGATASEVTSTSAFLSGEVNPNRWATAYLFEWGPNTEYGASTNLENVIEGEGNDFHPVSAAIANLEPGTVYHYRLVAINLTGVTNGPDQTFTTPNVPGLEATAATAVTQTTAHLSTRALANGSPTTVHFEYGPTTGYGGSTSATPIGTGVIAREVTADLGGLTPGTTYHVRAVATNGLGSSGSSDLTFTTAPAPAKPKPTEPKPEVKCKKGFKKVKVKGKTKCKKVKKKKKHKKHKKGKGKRNG